MRGLRTFTIALLVAALSVPLFASSAMGDSFHRDPDDVAATYNDIRTVRTVSQTPSRTLLLSATTYDDIQWIGYTVFYFYLDSRSGPPWDFVVTARMRRDVPVCLLSSKDSHHVSPVGDANFGPRRVTCRVKESVDPYPHDPLHGESHLSSDFLAP